MIIISQDKTIILNFENVEIVGIGNSLKKMMKNLIYFVRQQVIINMQSQNTKQKKEQKKYLKILFQDMKQ